MRPWEVVQARNLFEDIASNISYQEKVENERENKDDLQKEKDCGKITLPCETKIAASSGR